MIRFLFIIFFVMTFNVQAYAFELLMFNNKYCIYCKKFLREVGSEYNISDLPLIFIEGISGTLFRETAIALSFSIVVSSFVALTLSPMLASKFLNKKTSKKFRNRDYRASN